MEYNTSTGDATTKEKGTGGTKAKTGGDGQKSKKIEK